MFQVFTVNHNKNMAGGRDAMHVTSQAPPAIVGGRGRMT